LPQPAEAPAAEEGGGDVVDLLAALQRSVEKARASHDGGADSATTGSTRSEGAKDSDAGTSAAKSTSKKAAAKKPRKSA